MVQEIINAHTKHKRGVRGQMSLMMGKAGTNRNLDCSHLGVSLEQPPDSDGGGTC